MGVDIGKTNILVHAAAVIGRKYIFGQTGKITMEKQVTDMRFRAFLAMTVKISVFWDVTLCSLEGKYKHFRRSSCLHLQDTRICTEGRGQQVPPKCWYLSTRLRSVTSQKMVSFIIRVNFIKIFLYYFPFDFFIFFNKSIKNGFQWIELILLPFYSEILICFFWSTGFED
jgi:hypothetical protein